MLSVLLLGISAIVGSFVATAVLRASQRREFLTERSTCDACGLELCYAETVPILGWAILRGHCGSCGARIPLIHPFIEVLFVLLSAWAVCSYAGGMLIASIVLAWLLLTLASMDFVTLRLPNELNAALWVAGLAEALVLQPGTVLDRLIGSVAGFLSFTLISQGYRRIRRRSGLGLGDAKLLGALGAWLGWHPLPLVVLLASLISLLVVTAVRRNAIIDRLPFGPGLALAGWLSWLYWSMAVHLLTAS